MAVAQLNQDSKNESKRQVSTLKFPYYDLADSVAVAGTIHSRCGGAGSLDELAAHLNYGGVDNGAFKSRVGAARMFGLIEKAGDKFAMSQTAQAILMPVYDWMPAESLIKAFLSVELFSRVFEEYRGKQLPPEFGLKNALKTIFGVSPQSVERAYRVLMDSAQTAGFFDTRAGARTHLIIPTISKGSAVPAPTDQQAASGTAAVTGGGNGDDGGADGGVDKPIALADPSKGSSTLLAVKARYIESLVAAHEEKLKKGELDQALMTHIEKLLGIE